jgi:Protein of unknown function (DUF3071)
MSFESDENPTHLRLVGRSPDGALLELADENGANFQTPINDELREAVTKPRLAAVVSYDELPSFSVKDIQARLRSGESIDSISRTTDWPQEKIEKFAGPILQERAYVIDVALKSKSGRESKSPTLDEVMQSQLANHGVDLEEVEWNTHRLHDGTWNITLHYPNRDGATQANWSFELSNRVLTALDDSARWIIGEATQARTRTPSHGLVYGTEQTAPAPRLVSVREEIFVEELEIEVADKVSEPEERDASRDGVIKRPKLPSWDDIMFGGSKTEDE